MDNFKFQYLSSPTNVNEDLLYYIALIYEYRCEMFDKDLVLSNGYELRILRDSVFVPNGLLRLSYRNAIEQKKLVMKILEKLRVSYTIDYKPHVVKVNRLTYNGLIREYENIPKEMFDRIEELTT